MDETEKAPADFPRDDIPGAVCGAHPKLLLTKVGDRFLTGFTEDEIYRRWLVCEDLVQQIVAKTGKRMREGRINYLNDYVNKLQVWLEAQVWEGWSVTSAEARWMRDRIQKLVEEQRASE